MKENIDQASHRITLLEFVLILGVAVGGNILGSVVVAMIGYLLAKANYTTRASEWSAELLGVSLGMGLSIPLGILGGGACLRSSPCANGIHSLGIGTRINQSSRHRAGSVQQTVNPRFEARFRRLTSSPLLATIILY